MAIGYAVQLPLKKRARLHLWLGRSFTVYHLKLDGTVLGSHAMRSGTRVQDVAVYVDRVVEDPPDEPDPPEVVQALQKEQEALVIGDSLEHDQQLDELHAEVSLRPVNAPSTVLEAPIQTIVAQATPTNVVATARTILVDATTLGGTVVLPAPTAVTEPLVLHRLDATLNVVNVEAAGGALVNGATFVSLSPEAPGPRSRPTSTRPTLTGALAECARVGPIPPGPSAIDPEEPEDPRWAQCFVDLSTPLSQGQRGCAGWWCPDDTICDASSGRPRCVAPVNVFNPGGLLAPCEEYTDCAEGRPVFSGAGCICNAVLGEVAPKRWIAPF